MMAGFTRIREEESDDESRVAALPTRPLPPAPGGPSRVSAAMQDAGARMLGIALVQLSKRAVVAVSNLFTAALVGSAWLLWRDTLPQPSAQQLIGLGLYGAFVLLIEIVRRKAS